MTLADLLSALYDDLGYEAIPSPLVTRRLTRNLNEGYRHILSMPEFRMLRFNTLPFSSIAGQPRYGLPPIIEEISAIVDTTNNIRLTRMERYEYRTLDPQETATGTPTHYVDVGYHAVIRDPPGQPGGLWIRSTSAADTQLATIIGSHDGIPSPLFTVTLTGLTPVNFGFNYDLDTIEQFELSTPAQGLVHLALTSADALSGDNDLGHIPEGQQAAQFLVIRLWPTPSQQNLYHLDGLRMLTDLALTYAQPVLPSDFQYVLADYGRMREYEYRDDSRYPMALAAYQQKLRMMRNRVCDPPEYRPRVGRLYDGSSNLGSWYPNGRF